jgi:hypothetical protein
VGEMGVPALNRSQDVLDIHFCLVAKPVEAATAPTEAIGADANGAGEDAKTDKVCADACFEALTFDGVDLEAVGFEVKLYC